MNNIYRYELKYNINNNDFNIIKNNLKYLMDVDCNCINNSYTITSIYFDTYKMTSYKQVINGINDRWKYRIRYYNYDDSFIKLEKKSKKMIEL